MESSALTSPLVGRLAGDSSRSIVRCSGMGAPLDWVNLADGRWTFTIPLKGV